MMALSAENGFFRPFPLGKPYSPALPNPLFPSAPKRQVVCCVVSSDFRRIICSPRLSLSHERLLLLYGYYNSNQHLIQVKICTAVDKEKSDCGYFNWNTYAPYFESSWQNRTWRNLTEYNGICENPENAVFSRLSAPVRIENAVKIRVRKSPPILRSSNGFSEKPIRIFDRTERFFTPKSRFWQCVKSLGYAGLHPKSCRKMPGRNQNCRYRQKYK